MAPLIGVFPSAHADPVFDIDVLLVQHRFPGVRRADQILRSVS